MNDIIDVQTNDEKAEGLKAWGWVSYVLHLIVAVGAVIPGAQPGAALLIPVDDITALHAELRDRDYAYARPGIRDEDWGRILEVADPFGNKLRFWQTTQ